MERKVNLEISLNDKKYNEFNKVKYKEGNFLFQIGVKFCPKLKCINNTLNIETLNSIDLEEPGECFEIFQTIFEKLQEKNLVTEYYLEEIECELEASHPEYKFLDLINLVQNEEYYGIGFVIIGFDIEKFRLGLLANEYNMVNDIEKWLQEVINIIKEIKPDFSLLENDNSELEIENFITIEAYSI